MKGGTRQGPTTQREERSNEGVSDTRYRAPERASKVAWREWPGAPPGVLSERPETAMAKPRQAE